jgi:LCP family protein required for cell wall assembly
MARNPDNEERPYRVYRAGSATRPPDAEDGRAPGARSPGGGSAPSYRTYRAAPRGLLSRLRGQDDTALPVGGDSRGGGRRGRSLSRGPFTWKKGLVALVALVVAWVLLSVVLFFISAQSRSGNLPNGASAALSSAGPMLTSANNVLVLGLDNRPTTGANSREPGANHSERNARTDTIMLWRIGGGVSRRLSIPRDTLVNIPGYGQSKINAAWTYGGPALAIRTVERFTGVKINHLIVVDLGNFPKFIDDVGGVTVKTGRICSQISGGAANGGFTLNLRPGVHHLNGTEAEVLARTRENSCNAASNDLTREAMQQQILNSIKSQLFTFHTFLHLPWVAWDAPGVVQTDMGGLTMLQMFVSAEIGGSAPPRLLKETGGVVGGQDVLIPSSGNVRSTVNQLMNG